MIKRNYYRDRLIHIMWNGEINVSQGRSLAVISGTIKKNICKFSARILIFFFKMHII